MTQRICLLLVVFTSFRTGWAQRGLPALHLVITTNKTTHMLFPYPIRSVDLGSRELLAQKAPGTETCLQVKALKATMAETSLSVLTTDGRLWYFTVSYSAYPDTLVYTFTGTQKGEELNVTGNAAALDSLERILLHQKPFLHHGINAEFRRLTVTGLYTLGNLAWIGLRLTNRSPWQIHTGTLSFRKTSKGHFTRSALQQEELVPVYPGCLPDTLPPDHFCEVLVAFAPETLAGEGLVEVRWEDLRHRSTLKLRVQRRWWKKVRTTYLLNQ